MRHPMQPGQVVPQVGVNPDVLDAPLVVCVAGPCDGQQMRCPPGRHLFVISAVDGLRAVSLPPGHITIAKSLGGYRGHYEPGAESLEWHADASDGATNGERDGRLGDRLGRGDPEGRKKWKGRRDGWIAPFHQCPHCGESLSWQVRDDMHDQPWIMARCDCVTDPRNPGGGMVFNVELESEDVN